MAARVTEIEPVPGPDAFDGRTADARLSQAALILSVGAAVAGETDRIEPSVEFPLPSVSLLERREKIFTAEAAEPLRVDTGEYVRGEVGVIPREETSRIAHRLYDDPAPEMAAALAEAGLHSPDRLVRTAAAAATLDTTGPREEVVAILEDSAGSREETTRDIARTALAKVAPQHPRLSRLVTRPKRIMERTDPSHTAVLSHLKGRARLAMADHIKRLARPGALFLFWCFYGGPNDLPRFSLNGPSRVSPVIRPGEERELFEEAFVIEPFSRANTAACFLMTRR